MAKNGVYLIEDTHAAYWDSHGGSLKEPKSIINVSKNLIDKLNADHTKGQVESDDFTKSTPCIPCEWNYKVFSFRKKMEPSKTKEIGQQHLSNIRFLQVISSVL